MGVFWTAKSRPTIWKNSICWLQNANLCYFCVGPAECVVPPERRGPNLSGFCKIETRSSGLGLSISHARPFLRKGRRKARARIPPAQLISLSLCGVWVCFFRFATKWCVKKQLRICTILWISAKLSQELPKWSQTIPHGPKCSPKPSNNRRSKKGLLQDAHPQ